MNAATLSGGPADRSMTNALRATRLMGWASFGLAAAFLIAPGRIARSFGLEGKENLIRGFGAQEAMAGISALSTEPAPAMWARTAGDVVHLGTLATGLDTDDARTHRNVLIGLAVLAGFLVADGMIAAKVGAERSRARGSGPSPDYSDRSGFPQGVAKARGAAADFETPRDYRETPQEMDRRREPALA